MKNLKFLILLFLLPILSSSQSLSGIWTGVLSNDSLTIRKDQSFEMALTEYRGKVMGYAYSTFIVNDTLYYIIKRVKGEIKGDICEVEDDEVVTHNFPKKPEKKVSVVYTFRRSANDSAWTLDGNWKTNTTKKYYSISGDVKAKEEKDLSKSKLYDHLGDLNLQNTLAFNKPKDTQKEKTATKLKDDKKDVVKTESKPADNKPITDIAKADIKKPDAVVSEPPKQEVKSNVVKTESKPVDNKPITEIAKTDIKNPDVIVSAPPKQEVKADEKKSSPEYVFTDLKRTDNKLKPAVAMIEERESAPSETIFFKSDSLILVLYDNGEVDGDTVSVIMNGEIVIEKQGLKSVAFKKTIYLSPDDGDSVLLVLFAENLGAYPPNTGLLIIKDGEESYNVRFKADYDRNAAILLRKKLK